MELGQLVSPREIGTEEIPTEQHWLLSSGLGWLEVHFELDDDAIFENDVFAYREYTYCGCGCKDGTCRACLPNFEYKPYRWKLWWYKYPLRGATSSSVLSKKQVVLMIDDCLGSVMEWTQ